MLLMGLPCGEPQPGALPIKASSADAASLLSDYLVKLFVIKHLSQTLNRLLTLLLEITILKDHIFLLKCFLLHSVNLNEMNSSAAFYPCTLPFIILCKKNLQGENCFIERICL